MISDKQREMLAFIEEFLVKHGYPPTYEEIRAGLDISTKSLVNYHLEALEKATLLVRAPNTPRGIRLIQDTGRVRVPVVESVAVDSAPQPDELEPQRMLELTYDIVPTDQELYALKVQDNSMIDALVNAGDILILQPQTETTNGELVAARLLDRNQTTLRRYYRENGHVRLEPDNPTAASLIVKPDRVEVQGKVVALIRQVE